MRKRTEREREVIGKVEVIFRQLNILKDHGGYPPLLDIVVYAYAFPNEGFDEIISTLSEKNYYLGIPKNSKESICSEIVHIVKLAIERADDDYLAYLNLDKLRIILSGKRDEELEKELIHSIGEKYVKYPNDEKIVFFFLKRILEELKKGA